jgi:hypothetical protein
MDVLQNKHNQNKKQQSPMDMNIKNYSISDILLIFNLVDKPTIFQIKDVANNLIARMKLEGKMDMAIFFENAKQKLINNIAEAAADTDEEEDTDGSDADVESSYAADADADADAEEKTKWWEQECPTRSQDSRAPPPPIQKKPTIPSNNKANKMIEYEKNIIIEKLQMTELKLREIEKENKKLKKQIKILSEGY